MAHFVVPSPAKKIVLQQAHVLIFLLIDHPLPGLIEQLLSLGKLRAQTQDKRLCDRLINYLKSHSGSIEYGKFRRGGCPLGSGAIESANKFICHVRLKRSGAWWKLDNANNLLRLRCAIYNEKFDEVFNQYETEQRQLPPQRTTVLKRVK